MSYPKQDRREKIKSLVLHEAAIFFNENWQRQDLFITVFDVIISDDLEEAKFIFTFNQKISNEKEIKDKINIILKKFSSTFFKKSDFRKMLKLSFIISDERAFEGLENEII